MVLGIELGSTRIKGVLTDKSGKILAVGEYGWENKLIDGLWTYSLESVWTGIRSCYSALNAAYKEKTGAYITELDAIGISAMMHGYLVFDKDDNLLVPFRTWRNTNTGIAAAELTEALDFNMPQRWSATHFYQAVLNKEPHVKDAAFLTTLSGYVHYKLTGRKVIGIGDASGMFPIKDGEYDKTRIGIYDKLVSKRGVSCDLKKMLPEIALAGENAGELTEDGARLLDESGNLKSGAVFCAPEGDAGTGMVATNSVRERTGNVSAGTSAFAMIVLDKPLKNVHTAIDMITTPCGKHVAMIHANNCTSEINAWVNLFSDAIKLFGAEVKTGELYEKLFKISAESDETVGKIYADNFLAGEPIVGVKKGRPMVFRNAGGTMNVANFMQAQIYAAVAPLNIGMKILKEENVAIDGIYGHGGYFKTERIGQAAMSAALDVPVTVMKTAGEGGAYGIALLALYSLIRKDGETLADFLDAFFKDEEKSTVSATEAEKRRFANFMETYESGLKVARGF